MNANACDYSGQPLAELPDWSWRDDYDQGLSPADSFVDALASWVQFDD
ncbi:hypothetical protein GYA93_15940 [Gordonia desulfuricans]|uniref:Uncharacterized protein n=1 Tax=Gordonia desulfuricans TaxID=89051 RepID=A0A7K3LSR8_9ACTN|nr:hypothetical protein [Gordonia desulfuricans]NDK91061.1 hypothetical protein [Gordonia desulfuricans]